MRHRVNGAGDCPDPNQIHALARLCRIPPVQGLRTIVCAPLPFQAFKDTLDPTALDDGRVERVAVWEGLFVVAESVGTRRGAVSRLDWVKCYCLLPAHLYAGEWSTVQKNGDAEGYYVLHAGKDWVMTCPFVFALPVDVVFNPEKQR